MINIFFNFRKIKDSSIEIDNRMQQNNKLDIINILILDTFLTITITYFQHLYVY